jgi:hypothetical protein
MSITRPRLQGRDPRSVIPLIEWNQIGVASIQGRRQFGSQSSGIHRSAAATGAPHAVQNRLSGLITFPQEGQVAAVELGMALPGGASAGA